MSLNVHYSMYQSIGCAHVLTSADQFNKRQTKPNTLRNNEKERQISLGNEHIYICQRLHKAETLTEPDIVFFPLLPPQLVYSFWVYVWRNGKEVIFVRRSKNGIDTNKMSLIFYLFSASLVASFENSHQFPYVCRIHEIYFST